MLKITSFALGLLTLISLAPSAQAFPISGGNDRNSQPEIKVIVNPQGKTESRRDNDYSYRVDSDRRRQLELAREREARSRWEAAHRHHHGYYSYRSNHGDNYEYKNNGHREDNGGYYNNRDRH